MDVLELLVAFNTMRADHGYQAAERKRRAYKGGAEAMARAPEHSDERAAIMTMIDTWVTISEMMVIVQNKDDLDRIFRVLPVCHMGAVLRPAMVQLGHVPDAFQMLCNRYDEWLEGRPQEYVSKACAGQIQARFG